MIPFFNKSTVDKIVQRSERINEYDNVQARLLESLYSNLTKELTPEEACKKQIVFSIFYANAILFAKSDGLAYDVRYTPNNIDKIMSIPIEKLFWDMTVLQTKAGLIPNYEEYRKIIFPHVVKDLNK